MSLLVSLLVLAAATPATDALKTREAEIRKLLPPEGQPLTKAARKQAERAMVQSVDLEQMAAASLGEHAAGLAAAKRKEYDEVFAARFAHASGEQLEAFRSKGIHYQPEQPGDGGDVKVPTDATLDGEASQIVYVMHQEKGKWRIEDIVVDGVSTVENFKRSFGRVIAKEGIDGLIARLKKDVD